MATFARSLPVVLLTASACCLALAGARDDNEQEKLKTAHAAAADVAKLADAANDPAALKKLAQTSAKKYDDLSPFMSQMKPAEKGGIAVGRPGIFPSDSIELGLLQLGKKPPNADQLKANAADLTRMAEVICGIAEMPPYYVAKYAARPKGQDRWNARSHEMGQWGHELLAVVEKNDAKNLPKVLAKLNQSCSDCHAAFRDGNAVYDAEHAALAVNNPRKLQDEAAALTSRYPLDDLSVTFRPRDKGGLGVGPEPGRFPNANAGPSFVPSPIGTKARAPSKPDAAPNPNPDATPNPPATVPDGIEARLEALGHTPPTAAQLAAQAKDLQHMAEVVRVIAEATPGYAGEYATKPKEREKWQGFSDDMKQGSDDLIAAVKANDIQALQMALSKLNQTCADCHKQFR